ncbi:MAG: YdcF family protein [Clostridium fessum]
MCAAPRSAIPKAASGSGDRVFGGISEHGSGAFRRKRSGREISEARAMYEYLQYNGIPEDKLLIEDQSSDTVQNIEFSRTVIDRQGIQQGARRRGHT